LAGLEMRVTQVLLLFFLRRNNDKFKGSDELMLVILNCILQHNQHDGWTLPKPYFRICCKNVYLRILFLEKRLHCLIKNCMFPFGHLEFKCQCFGTLGLFHLHRGVGRKCDSG
jgi:hypothetical protein